MGGTQSVVPVHPSAKKTVNITLIFFFFFPPPDPKPHTADTSQTKLPTQKNLVPVQIQLISLQRGDEVAGFGLRCRAPPQPRSGHLPPL